MTNLPSVHIESYHRGRFSHWDYLIILDACRYDVFSEVYSELSLPGPLTKVNTGEINTSFWYRRHWSHEDTDATLITANPWTFKASNKADERFARAIWADPEGEEVKGREAIMSRITPLFAHSGGFGVFHPKVALECFAEYKEPGLRYVIHLIPPHLPFIGERGKELFSKLKIDQRQHGGVYRAIRNYGRKGNWEELRACYKESVVATLQAIHPYSDLFSDGRLVITSDHGELIGEPFFDDNGMYWHKVAGISWGVRNSIREMLQEVPWWSTEISEWEL